MELESLPRRGLSEAEVAALNRADAVDLAVAVEADGAEGDPAEAVVVATESAVTGLWFDGDGWVAVERTPLSAVEERYDALRACEDALRERLDGG